MSKAIITTHSTDKAFMVTVSKDTQTFAYPEASIGYDFQTQEASYLVTTGIDSSKKGDSFEKISKLISDPVELSFIQIAQLVFLQKMASYQEELRDIVINEILTL